LIILLIYVFRDLEKNRVPILFVLNYLIMKELSSEVLSSFKTALSLLTGYKKRQLAAELAGKFFDDSPRKTERYLGVKRDMVKLGLHESRTGIRCKDAYPLRGRKKKKRSTPA